MELKVHQRCTGIRQPAGLPALLRTAHSSQELVSRTTLITEAVSHLCLYRGSSVEKQHVHEWPSMVTSQEMTRRPSPVGGWGESSLCDFMLLLLHRRPVS